MADESSEVNVANAPVPPIMPPARAKFALLATGQTGCWDTAGAPVPTQGSGQDAAFRSGTPLTGARFIDNHDGTVSDTLTGLVWLQDADAFGEVSWDDALQNALTLAPEPGNPTAPALGDGSKAGDWRLPNIRELLSLLDYGQSDPIVPLQNPFANVRTAIYWTSTTLLGAPIMAWMITLGIGPTVFDIKQGNRSRMWPVRSGPQGSLVAQTGQKVCFDSQNNPIATPKGTGQDGELQSGVPSLPDRFKDNNDGTVTDNATGLLWLKNANPFGSVTWQDALNMCNALKSGDAGLTDGSVAGQWRLPNIREAESLVDYGQEAPCLPAGHPFAATVRPSSYWTSTSVTIEPTEAMFIIYGVGPSIFENKEHPFFAWPVRNRK